MQTVLSLDVDYFVNPKVAGPRRGRPSDDTHVVRDIEHIIDFLATKCLVGVDNPVAGRAAIDHDAAFWAIRDWIRDDRLQIPFNLVHIDAHADLGFGDAGYSEILDDVIRRPLDQRAGNLQHLSMGNWLSYAVANRWINEVQFLREPDPGRDPELIPHYFFGSPDFSVMQMRPMIESQYMDAWDADHRRDFANLPTDEPPVRWNQLGEDRFQLLAPPDFMFACLSPQFAPPNADRVFSLVRDAIREDIPLTADEIGNFLQNLR